MTNCITQQEGSNLFSVYVDDASDVEAKAVILTADGSVHQTIKLATGNNPIPTNTLTPGTWFLKAELKNITELKKFLIP